MPLDCIGFSSPANSFGDANLSSRYSDVELIGQGSTCLVLKAHDKFLDRQVAIKYMRPEVTDLNRIRRFQQEAKVMSSFKTKHLPVVLDFGLSSSRQPYMVMELVDGFSLAEFLEEYGLVDVPLCLEITIQILSALIHTHEHGIIHRDLKAKNVMISWMGEGGPCVKVVDFGLASLSHQGNENLTEAGPAVGTPLYMSPEQAQGRVVDARSDLYSVDCMIFEMLTGRTPFVGECLMKTLDAHVRLAAPALGSFIPIDQQALSELESIVTKTLEKNPSQRYQTAAEMKMVLEAVQDNIQESGTGSEQNMQTGSRCRTIVEPVGKRFLDKVASISEGEERLRTPGAGADLSDCINSVHKENKFDFFTGLAEGAGRADTVNTGKRKSRDRDGLNYYDPAEIRTEQTGDSNSEDEDCSEENNDLDPAANLLTHRLKSILSCSPVLLTLGAVAVFIALVLLFITLDAFYGCF